MQYTNTDRWAFQAKKGNENFSIIITAAFYIPMALALGNSMEEYWKFWSQAAWLKILGPPLTSRLIMGQSLYLSLPQYLMWKNMDHIRMNLTGLLCGFNELIDGKQWAQCLTQKKGLCYSLHLPLHSLSQSLHSFNISVPLTHHAGAWNFHPLSLTSWLLPFFKAQMKYPPLGETLPTSAKQLSITSLCLFFALYFSCSTIILFTYLFFCLSLPKRV